MHAADLQLYYKWNVISSKINSVTGIADILLKFSQIIFKDFANIFGKYVEYLKMWYLTKPMINRANQISMFRVQKVVVLVNFLARIYVCNT